MAKRARRPEDDAPTATDSDTLIGAERASTGLLATLLLVFTFMHVFDSFARRGYCLMLSLGQTYRLLPVWAHCI
eukprot:5857109-Pleurochrysis_carterae.AAC.1